MAKGDLKGTVIDKNQQVKLNADGSIDANDIVKKVLNQTQEIKTNSSTPTYFLYVPDLKENVQISSKGIVHGFFDSTKKGKKASNRDLINARAVLDLPNILENSIEVNISERKKNLDIPYSHILIGTVGIEDSNSNIEYYAIRTVIEERINLDKILVETKVLGKLKGINAKKIDSPNLKVANNSVARRYDKVYEYNIANFLQDVNQIFDDTFSNDVYNHFNKNRKSNDFSKNLRFSYTSTTDSQGNTLSKEQQEFFKDSKVRNEKGELEVVYHGTVGEFHTFDKTYLKCRIYEFAKCCYCS